MYLQFTAEVRQILQIQVIKSSGLCNSLVAYNLGQSRPSQWLRATMHQLHLPDILPSCKEKPTVCLLDAPHLNTTLVIIHRSK